jgi:hypothetical protein
VSFLLPLLANRCLAGILLISVMLASRWGELAGIAPGFDQTSLSGLMAARTAMLLGLALILVHLLPFRARLQDMQRVAAARVET